MEEKILLRRAIKERLAKLSENDRRVESQIIVRELTKHIGPEPMTVAVYIPFLDEPNILPLITDLLKRKFVICMAKAEGRNMKMHRIFSLEGIRRNPVTNIPEPMEEDAIEEPSIGVVLVPGRAFSKECVRLGRGNGGYDTWMASQRNRNPATRYIGICFDCQIVDAIPEEAHDERMDIVITPTRMLRRES